MSNIQEDSKWIQRFTQCLTTLNCQLGSIGVFTKITSYSTATALTFHHDFPSYHTMVILKLEIDFFGIPSKNRQIPIDFAINISAVLRTPVI